MTEEQYLRHLLKDTKRDARIVGVMHVGFGIGLLLGGSRFDSTPVWPIFMVSGVLAVIWAARPHFLWAAVLSGVLGGSAYILRANIAITQALTAGQLSRMSQFAAIELVITSHTLFAWLIYSVWLSRVVPISKSITKRGEFKLETYEE